ncbi:Hypothetical protein NTJ_06629 [Nesidiocoris tenuis]|uniref:Uncharacterized protein n=1 Tax=Nesidiocoris tenuis TaxID=355587 RepID=A0ABN7ANL6_9HEMI|nr:Hypothetical protein NTJ_06629 [Nesidiocoris tenuis]
MRGSAVVPSVSWDGQHIRWFSCTSFVRHYLQNQLTGYLNRNPPKTPANPLGVSHTNIPLGVIDVLGRNLEIIPLTCQIKCASNDGLLVIRWMFYG